MRNVAYKALRYGILAIVSTLAFYFATMAVDSLGHSMFCVIFIILT